MADCAETSRPPIVEASIDNASQTSPFCCVQADLETVARGHSNLTDLRGYMRLDASACSCQRSLREGHRGDGDDVVLCAMDQDDAGIWPLA
ncbi:hypothetical protein [Gluconobacter sp. P5B12]|uniref:hypothetical protein n=1 Tax=Gluconobacter sp. P5B12 TaxID=2762618 RepID=UPI000551E351|nr:hypothetical protein [Gluconobacter sp. P5B12]